MGIKLKIENYLKKNFKVVLNHMEQMLLDLPLQHKHHYLEL